MSTFNARLTLLLSLGVPLLFAPTAFAAPPAPCQAIPAETWGSIMGYQATATPGEMNCTYTGPTKKDGGQFRIIGITGSSAEAEVSAKRMRDLQAHQPKGGHDPGLNVVDSQGTVVFSIALFQHEASANTAAQLQRLLAAAKQHLPK